MEKSQILDAYGKPIEIRSGVITPEQWLIDAFGGGTTTSSGERVNWRTALTVMTFFACVRNISEDLASLPKWAMMRKGKSTEKLPDHPMSRLMQNPSRIMNRHTFWQTFFSHGLMHKGAYAYIANGGEELVLLDPEQVQVSCSERTGETIFFAYGKVLFDHEVLHYRELGNMGECGFAMPEIAKQVIGAAIALQKMRGAFFGSGMIPSGILEHPASLSEAAQKRLKKHFEDTYTGSDKAYSMMLLEEGMKYTQISTDPEKAQMPELSFISIEEICRLFRMPPVKVQHLQNSHYNTTEQQQLDYGGDTIAPRADRFRAECEFKLLRRSESSIFLDVNLNALARADMAARTAFYKDMYYLGVYNADRIAELEHDNPVPEGKRYFVQQNLVPADRVDDLIDARAKPATPPGAAGPASPPPQPSPNDTFMRMLEAKIGQLLREDLRVIERAEGKRRDWPDFYRKRRATMTEHLAPFMFPLCEWYGCTTPGVVLADGIAATLCSDSLVLVESGEFSNWKPGARAVDAAQMVIENMIKENDDEQDAA